MNFGDVLRVARERAGIDVASAARELRIRPDIVRAIEDADFSRMPPRGYTRNMVNAYARMLGLNPSEITNLYLSEVYAYEVGRARGDTVRGRLRPAVSDRRGGSRSTGRTERMHRDRYAASDGEDLYGEGRTSALGHKMYSDSPRGQFFQSNPAGRTLQQRAAADRTHPTRHTALPGNQYTNFYAGPSTSGGVRSRLPIIIAVAVILVLAIVILMLAFGRGGGSAQTDVPTVPVTGIADTTGDSQSTSEDQTANETTQPVAPTSMSVSYEVAAGASPWIEVYENGSTTVSAGVVTGPADETFDVTGTLTISTAQPGNVTVLVEGEAVELTDDDGDGMYTYTADFNAYLEQWRTDNGVSADDESADSTQSGNSGVDAQSTDPAADGQSRTSGSSSSNGTTTTTTS